MRLKTSLLAIFILLAAIGILVVDSNTAEHGRGDGPVIYVTSQGLYYDSIVTADPLPPFGPFQILEMGPNGLETEFGPRDREYVGGRWVETFSGSEPHYFACPLLPPGRENP